MRHLMTAVALATGIYSTSFVRADILVNFETVDAINTDFNHTPALPFAEADGVGLGGTRGLQVTGTVDSYATYKTAGLNFAPVGSRIAVSAFFKTVDVIGGTGEQRILELNIVSDPTSVVTAAHVGVGGKLPFVPTAGFDVGVEFRRNNANVAGSITTTGFTVLPANWYKATFTATNNGDLAVIPSTMVLDDYGPTGAALVTASVLSHAFDIPATAISTDTEVWPAFRVRNGTRLISVIDNFQATLTPGATPTGGANFDGLNGVDGKDFLIWQRGLGLTGQTTNANGDADGPGTADAPDLAIWRTSYGAAATAVATSIPEPSAVVLLAVGAIGLAARRRQPLAA